VWSAQLARRLRYGKNVLSPAAAFGLDESIAFLRVEPLHRAPCHCRSPIDATADYPIGIFASNACEEVIPSLEGPIATADRPRKSIPRAPSARLPPLPARGPLASSWEVNCEQTHRRIFVPIRAKYERCGNPMGLFPASPALGHCRKFEAIDGRMWASKSTTCKALAWRAGCRLGWKSRPIRRFISQSLVDRAIPSHQLGKQRRREDMHDWD
jgi:hypothetical protein